MRTKINIKIISLSSLNLKGKPIIEKIEKVSVTASKKIEK